MYLETFLISPLIGVNHLFLHWLHLWSNLLFLSPIKLHPDLIFFLSLQFLHSSL